MPTGTVKFHRVLRARPERVYRAFLEAEAIPRWLPPYGFTCKVHQMDPRVGGTYRMSFTNFGTGHTHYFGGTYLELQPHERIVYTDVFEDPALQGEMRTIVGLRAVSCGVKVPCSCSSLSGAMERSAPLSARTVMITSALPLASALIAELLLDSL